MMTVQTTRRDHDPVDRLTARMLAWIDFSGGVPSMDRRHLHDLAYAVAWQWIELTGRPDALPSEWLPRVCRALTACGAPQTGTLLMLFHTRLVRPASWTFHGNQPFWILDCSRLAMREAEKTALMLDRCLTTLFTRLAPLWDTAAGAGALGLRRGLPLADALADPVAKGCRSGRRRGLLEGLRRYCAERLALLATERDWPAPPTVVLLQT